MVNSWDKIKQKGNKNIRRSVARNETVISCGHHNGKLEAWIEYDQMMWVTIRAISIMMTFNDQYSMKFAMSEEIPAKPYAVVLWWFPSLWQSQIGDIH